MINTQISQQTRKIETHVISSQEAMKNEFINPQVLMQGLLSQGSSICNCGKSMENKKS